MVCLWLFGIRRLGRREKIIIAFLLFGALFLISFHSRIDRSNSPDAPVASFRISGSAAKATIPRIVHQTWCNRELPELVKPWIESWILKNPSWEYWLWSDEDMREFIRLRFPKYLKLYDSYPNQAYRNDAFRYFLLYEYGGIYADVDMECLQSVDVFLDTQTCVVSQEPTEHAHFLSTMGPPLVSNAWMACKPKHPFFLRIINDLSSYAGFWYWKSVIHATGPNMLTEVYRGYHHTWFTTPSHPVHLASPDEFQPVPDTSMVERMREMCVFSDGKDLLSDKFMARQQQLCKRLSAFNFNPKPSKDSYALHHWTHTWAGKKNDPYGVHGSASRTFDADTLKFVRS